MNPDRPPILDYQKTDPPLTLFQKVKRSIPPPLFLIGFCIYATLLTVKHWNDYGINVILLAVFVLTIVCLVTGLTQERK